VVARLREPLLEVAAAVSEKARSAVAALLDLFEYLEGKSGDSPQYYSLTSLCGSWRRDLMYSATWLMLLVRCG